MTKIEPANPFWEGYNRDPKTTAQLIELLSAALYAHPSMRLGQLLVNLSRGCDIWDVWDETWIRAMENFLEGTEVHA